MGPAEDNYDLDMDRQNRHRRRVDALMPWLWGGLVAGLYLAWGPAGVFVGGILVFLGFVLFQATAAFLIPAKLRRRRLAIFASDYGRDGGWFVEWQGRRVALLTDPRFAEMFWDSYRIEPITDDPAEVQRLVNDIDWWLELKFVYRSRQFDEVAEFAFPAGAFPEAGRVQMRGLYLNIGQMWLWEKMVVWLRRRRKPKP